LNPIEIIFRGKDETKAATESVKQGLDGVQDAAKKTGGAFDTAMGVLAAQQIEKFGNAVSGFMKDAIDEASAAQAGMVQLEQVIESTGGAAGLTADEISEMATAFSRITIFEDDAIIAGQTILAQFTSIGQDVFPQATEAMLNLATRMKIDLPAAAKIVGKAMEGEFSGLSRFGVVIDEATKKQIDGLIKVGDTAGAQALILAELEKRFGGAAEAAGSTFAGSMERLNNAWGDFKETIGGALVENENFQKMLDKIIELVNGLADAFVAMPEPVQTGVVAIAGLGAVLAKLAPALISLKVLFGGLAGAGGVGALGGALAAIKGAAVAAGAAIAGLGAPVLLLIGAIAGLIAVIVIFGKDALATVQMVGQIFSAVFARIIFEAANFAIKLAQAFQRGYDAARQAGQGIVQGIWAGIQSGWQWLLNMIQANMSNLLEWVKNLLGISSPSKVFADQVGKQMALGIGMGFEKGMQNIQPSMSLALQPAFATANSAPAQRGSGTVINGQFSFYSPLTHDERRKLRRDQTETAQREMLRMLK
jgi:hypothetical protein